MSGPLPSSMPSGHPRFGFLSGAAKSAHQDRAAPAFPSCETHVGQQGHVGRRGEFALHDSHRSAVVRSAAALRSAGWTATTSTAI